MKIHVRMLKVLGRRLEKYLEKTEELNKNSVVRRVVHMCKSEHRTSIRKPSHPFPCTTETLRSGLCARSVCSPQALRRRLSTTHAHII